MHSFSEILDKLNAFGKEQSFPKAPAELYEPCDYILSLGGKRLRPALALMAAELMGGDPDLALHPAWAVELFHNFSLIHDDIMDAAPLRRGQPTVHMRWDLTTGILSGDVMLIYAYQHLAQTPKKEVLPQLLEVFNRVAIGVCEGQQLDINFEKRAEVSLEEYLYMIELKTAVLLGGALEMGALAAGSTAQDAALLYDFGRLAGIAFQIQDDLLDTYGDPETFGKQVGGDILQNKKTFLVLKTLEIASEADALALRQLLSSATQQEPESKIAAVRSLFDKYQVPALVQTEKARFEQKAFDALAAVSAPDSRKEVLRSMVAELLHRQK
ncbi:MAG: polyprenyl synthetase family protein [Chitinophagales bacterium]